jgi:sugar lactone lactonase YvrE
MKKILLLICIIVSSNSFSQELTKIAEKLNFPEGPAWDGKGTLYLSSCYGGYIYKISGASSEVFIDSASSPMKQTNGLTVGRDGNIYACDFGNGSILKITPDKKVETICPGYQGRPFNRPNDLAFRTNGDLYFSVPHTDKPDGSLFRLNTLTGELQKLRDSLCYPNGLAFNADATELYLSESAKNRILKYKLDKEGNILSGGVFIDLPGGEPDGLAFDAEGNLYCAHFGGGTVYVITPDGKVKEKIRAPGTETSNVEFGGDDYRTLFITEDETDAVYSLRRETAGLKLNR